MLPYVITCWATCYHMLSYVIYIYISHTHTYIYIYLLLSELIPYVVAYVAQCAGLYLARPARRAASKTSKRLHMFRCTMYGRNSDEIWNKYGTNADIPGSSKKTAIHRKPQSYPAYPRNPQLQCCDRKCRTSTEMAVSFEGRQTHNSEDNIELGDGGGMTSAVWYFMGWLFFLKNPVSFFFGFRVHFNCCWYECGCRSAHIHTHTSMRQHQLLKFTHCQ